MEEYKEKSGNNYIQNTIEVHPLQPQQSENITENTQSPSESGAAIGENNPVPLIPVQNVNYFTTTLPKIKLQKNGASRMAGFMFWTTSAGVILLLIGFVSPGWLTVQTHQKCHLNTYFSYDSGDRIKYKYVYQDYSLWYITQCYDPGTGTACNTTTYRLIDNLYDSHDCAIIVIGSLAITDTLTLLYFSDAALVFSYSEIVRAQALYTVGFVLALSSLCSWYKFRKGVAKDKSTGLSKTKWAFLFIETALSAIFVFVPVFTYAATDMQIRDSKRDDLKSPVGVVFAGFGGGMIVLCSGAILLHLICCRNNDGSYLCSTEEYNPLQVPEEEV